MQKSINYICQIKNCYRKSQKNGWMKNRIDSEGRVLSAGIVFSGVGSIPKDISNYLEMSFFAFVKGH